MNQPSNRSNIGNIPSLISNMQFFNPAQNQNFQTTGYNIGNTMNAQQIGMGMNYNYATGFTNNLNNSIGLNTSQQLNSSGQQFNNLNPIGTGTIGAYNTQYAMPFMISGIPDLSNRSGNLNNQQNLNMIPINNDPYAGQNNLMLPQILQQNMNVSNSILAQINQMNLEKFQRLKIEDEASQKQIEEDKEFKKRFQEEWKKFLLSKEEMEMIKPLGDGINLKRSEYLCSMDRFFFEQLIQHPLKTEGCLGMSLVNNLDKSNLYKSKDGVESAEITTLNYINKNDKDFFKKMEKDGIYLDYVKNTIYSYNLQKVEQRALRENKLDWFKFNGDLRLENDIFDDVVTIPTDISLSTNDRFNIRYVSNSMCVRSSQRKFKIYKIKIFLSKLFFSSHPLFIEEDILCSELKEYYFDYYKQMNMMNIPYYKEKIFTISRQLDEFSKIKDPSEAVNLEIKYMKLFVEESIKFLENEKKILNIKANLLYGKWIEIKKLRDIQKFQSTNSKLSVLRFPTNGNQNPNVFDYAFVLSNSEPTYDLKFLTRTEIQRREKIKKLQCYLKIYINEVYVADTKKYHLLFPGFEIDLNDLIQINVYSRPTKIELELYIGSFSFKKIARFEIEPPGVFSNTITSSSTLLEEVEFNSKNEEEKFQNKNEVIEYSNTLNLMKDSLQGNKEENEKLLIAPVENIKNSKNMPNKKIEKIYKGKIKLKVEWEGQGSEMPPTKIEDKINLVKRRKEFKGHSNVLNRHDYPYDINDPRNIIYLEQMKKYKTEILLKYLNKEYMLPFYDLKSLRHFLLVKRQEKMSLKNLKIPILETEIDKSQEIRKVLRELDDDKQETEEEQEKRIKTELEKLNKMYSGHVLTEEEYVNMLTRKIKTLKKDIVNKLQMSYFQVISEYFYNSDLMMVTKNLCSSFVSPKRKLAPRKKLKTEAKIEMIKEIKITIHIVKGYNMPVRNESIPASIRDQIKSHAIRQVYKSGVGTNFTGLNNQLLKREISNKGMGNILMEMQNQNLNMNSGVFGNINTGNQSLMGGINMNINDINYNNNNNNNPSPGMNIPGIGAFNVPSSPVGGYNPYNAYNAYNPSLQNVMFNPNQPNMMYNPSNLLYNPSSNLGIPNQIKNYEGDILEMIEILKGVEKIVESFIQVNMNYYDQECEMRTESIDGLHPDYNSKMRFSIKPKNGKTYFSRDELAKCHGSFYFNLYDELRSEQKIQEKDSNTYIYKYEKKYLGSFQIPFSTIFQNASLLETVCKINIPPTVFGYYSDLSSTYDILQHREEDLRKSENVNKNLNVENNEASKSTFRLNDNVSRIVNPFINTYLSLYITMDPVPGFLKTDEIDYVPGFEDSVFLINTTKWLKNLQENLTLRLRNIKLLIENFDGYSVFIPRYLRATGQKPPEIVFDEVNNINDDLSIEKAARFVSLIPFVEDCHTFDHESMPDCWCTDEQFLTLGFGDYEEHSILLCNYFNYIDRLQNRNCSSYIVLGKGYPEGLTTYVMRVSNTTPDIEFWNAKRGECFYFDKKYHDNKFLCFTVNRSFNTTKNSSNTICSLKEIGCIVSPDNVYVNIQSSGDPGFIDFNLKNESNWKPFLNENSKKKYFPGGIATIQKDLVYEYPDSKDSYQLSKEIYEHLKKEIEISRYSLEHDGKPLRTRWDRAANEKIETILAEYDLFNFCKKQSGINIVLSGRDVIQSQKQIQDEVVEKLINIQYQIENEFVGVRQKYGFPINVSFTTLQEIWKEIKFTETHLVADENSELSLSVYVNGYPAKVYSVWVFLAVLKK